MNSALQNLYRQVQQPGQQSNVGSFGSYNRQQEQWFNPQPQQQQPRSNAPPPGFTQTQQQQQQRWMPSPPEVLQRQRSMTPPPAFQRQRSMTPPGFVEPTRSVTPPPSFQRQPSRFQQPRPVAPPPSFFQPQAPQYQQQQFFQQQPQQQQQFFQQQSPYPQQQQFPYQQHEPDYIQQPRPRGAASPPPPQSNPRPQQQTGRHPATTISKAVVPEPSAIASTSSTREQIHSTLTEPVSVTLARDAKRVMNNIRQIVVFNSSRNDPARTLRDWDLWGPFFFVIAMSCVLSSTATTNKSAVFAVVFAVLSAGAVSLTMNVVLLGGKLNFLQSLSVLGYCLFPLDVGAVLCAAHSGKLYRSLMVLITFLWSSWSVYPFVTTAVRPSRKALAVYPVFLMYISMGFLVLAND